MVKSRNASIFKREKTPSAVVAQIGGTHYSRCAGRCPHCGREIQHWDLFARVPYLEAQIARYVLRWLEKGGLEDLDKAQSFLTKLRAWAVEYGKTADPQSQQ